MASMYDSYWEDRLPEIREMLESSVKGKSTVIDFSDIKAISDRKPFHAVLNGKEGTFSFRSSNVVAKSLMNLLNREDAAVGRSFKIRLDKSFNMHAEFLGTQSPEEASLTKYLQEFSTIADTWFKEITFLEPNYRFFRKFFTKKHIKNAEWKDIQQIGEHLHAFSSNYLARTKAFGNPNHLIDHYRNSFLYLAFGKDPVKERISNFFDNKEYKIAYLGKGSVGEICGNLFADDYVLYNNRTIHALEVLEIDPSIDSRDRFGDQYIKLNEAITPIIAAYNKIVGRRTAVPLNMEVDQFLSWLYETYYGKKFPPPPPDDKIRYWVIAPGERAAAWDEFYTKGIIGIGWDDLGDLSRYSSVEEVNNAWRKITGENRSYINIRHACYYFAHVLEEGDIVIAKQGQSKIIGYGVVESGYIFDDTRDAFKHIRKIHWLHKGEWLLPKDTRVPNKTLTEVTGNAPLRLFIKTQFESNEPATVIEAGLETNYWWLNANPRIWKINDFSIGDKQIYTTHNERNNKRNKFKYFAELKPGDIMIGYESSPVREIKALYEVTMGVHDSPEGEGIEFQIKELLKNPVKYTELKNNPDLQTCEPIINNQGSLFKVTQEEYEIIQSIIDDSNPQEEYK